jgi:parvulin-like peptidyl-prolyl isomerase
LSQTLGRLISVATIVLAGGVSCDGPKAPIAHVGSTWLGQPEWTAYLKAYPGGDLAGIIRQELAYQLAEKQGLLKGIEWQDYDRISRRTALSQAYLDSVKGHGRFSESQAKEAYLASTETRRVSHILCATQAQAEAALKRVASGEAFDRVAVVVSTDPSAKQNKGDLGWIKREQMVAPFSAAVFAVKPEVLCGPFQTEFGWHVARVNEVRLPDPAAFEKAKARIMAEMQEALDAPKRPGALKPLREEYHLIVDKAVLDVDRTVEVAPGDENRQAGRIGERSITLRELKLFMSENLKMSGSSHGLGPETKEKFLELLADDYRLSLAAEKQGLDHQPDVKAAIWMTQRNAAFAAFSKSYLSSYRVPESDLNTYFSANKDRFRSIGAVKLHLLVADQAETIDAAAKDGLKGTPWVQLFNKYANKASTGNWDAGWLEVSSLQKLLPKEAIRAMLKNPEGTLIGPVPGPEGFMLFRVLERKPGELMPFKDCREQVLSDYLKEQGAKLVDKYLDADGRSGIRVQAYPKNAIVQQMP